MKRTTGYALVSGVCLLAFLLVFGWLHREKGLDMQGLMEVQLRKSRIVAQMLTDLLGSVQAEKSAILADSDGAAREFADKAVALSDKVERGRQELRPYYRNEPAGQEARLLDEFDAAWTELRAVDKELLGLAVLNTNAKAYRISATQALGAFKEFELALDQVVRLSAQSRDAGLVSAEAYRALSAVTVILAMQVPHIAEASDARMDEMEREMAASSEAAGKALGAMRPLLAGQALQAFEEAGAALRRFGEVNGEVLRLSRINSNVKALALSMGQKRRVAARCEEILATLQGVVDSRLSKATR